MQVQQTAEVEASTVPRQGAPAGVPGYLRLKTDGSHTWRGAAGGRVFVGDRAVAAGRAACLAALCVASSGRCRHRRRIFLLLLLLVCNSKISTLLAILTSHAIVLL